MNYFQIIVLPILGILFIERLIAVLRGRGPRGVALFWMIVWLTSALAIAWPGITNAIARPLGIGRGVNLVLYFAILFMFIGFFTVYVRLRRLDANITKLVRHLAVGNPISPDSVPRPDGTESAGDS